MVQVKKKKVEFLGIIQKIVKFDITVTDCLRRIDNMMQFMTIIYKTL